MYEVLGEDFQIPMVLTAEGEVVDSEQKMVAEDQWIEM